MTCRLVLPRKLGTLGTRGDHFRRQSGPIIGRFFSSSVVERHRQLGQRQIVFRLVIRDRSVRPIGQIALNIEEPQRCAGHFAKHGSGYRSAILFGSVERHNNHDGRIVHGAKPINDALYLCVYACATVSKICAEPVLPPDV